MQNVTVGQVVVGKVNADVVFKVAEFGIDHTLFLTTAVHEMMAGKTVGIQPMTPVNKKMHIAEAQLIVNEIQAAFQQAMDDKFTGKADEAVVETAAASTNNKGAVGTMGKQKFNSREEMINAASTVVKGENAARSSDRAVRNPNVGRFQSHAETVAMQRFLDLGEFPVEVFEIEWFPKADRFGRIGAVRLQLFEGYATVRFWDNKAKEAFWYDFCDFSLDQFRNSFNPADGSGELTLAIRLGKDGQMYINLPKSEYQGEWYDKMKTRDVRFPDADPNGFNNRNLEAALTAYVRFFVSKFVQANPANRHGVDENCGACKFNMYVPGYDGMENEPFGFRNTLNTSDTIEMIQWGQEIPRRFCMVHKELVDLDAVKEVNELAAQDATTYYDEEGALKTLKPDEVLVAGKAVNKYVALKQGMMERCAGCAFYHNNSPKGEKQISKEKAEGKEYVSKYWSEEARADRMPIQTLVNNGKHDTWVNEYPGAVENPLDFRVVGIGGISVYASKDMVEVTYDENNKEVVTPYEAIKEEVLSFIPMTEQENVTESRAAKLINVIHQTCNNYTEIMKRNPKTLDQLDALIAKKPSPISDRMSKRWDAAIVRLAETVTKYDEGNNQ